MRHVTDGAADSAVGLIGRYRSACDGAYVSTPREHSVEPTRPVGWVAALVLPIAAALVSVTTPGIHSAFWCYPAVVLCYVVLSRRLALVCSLALLALTAAATNRCCGADVATRFVISLGLVIIIVSMMLKRIGDLQRTLAKEAITDPLTGAFNRRYMERYLTIAIERLNRTGEPVSLLLFDVDHFKQINDTWGHLAGDEVLKALVALVAGRARKLDALFRIGGEEFLLLLPGTPYVGALAIAEDLRARVAGAHLLDGTGVSISVGLSELQEGQSPYGWMAEVDGALARAKQGGRNRVAGRAFAANAS